MLKTRRFILGLCLVLLLSILSPGVASAANVDSIQGVIGTLVTVSNLTSGQSYQVIWDSTTYDSGIVPTTGVVTFSVPDSTGGSHAFTVQSPAGTSVFSSNYTVLPSITTTPDSGTIGTTVTVNGKGFAALESNISVLFDNNSVKSSISASSTGAWTATFSIPSSSAGTHTIDAYGYTTVATNVADKTIIVKAGIAISPTAGGVGSSITVTGTGFASGESAISIYFDNTAIKTGINADSTGSWTSAFTVPGTFSGSHSISASGATTAGGGVSGLPFTVISGLGIDKTTAYVGDPVIVSGSGFGAGESNIYVTFDGINRGSSISADAIGQWRASLTVPASTSGTHSIGAVGTLTTISSNRTLTVAAKVIVNPTSGNVGDTITVAGTGFGGSSALGVMFGTVSVLSNIATDATGGFSGTFKAPKGINGDVKIIATDASAVSANAVFSMDKIPPPVPQLTSPAKDAIVGFVGDIKVNFKWTEVTDPSGVSYDLQVADDVGFKSTRLQYSKLLVNDYKTTDSEELPQGKYYWRVRAVDDANNASDWTSPIQFTAGFMSTSTLIIIVVVLVVILAVLLRIKAVFGKH